MRSRTPDFWVLKRVFFLLHFMGLLGPMICLPQGPLSVLKLPNLDDDLKTHISNMTTSRQQVTVVKRYVSTQVCLNRH